MRDLTAHVTSCLLQFPDVTIQALGEDEIALDCVLYGKFTGGKHLNLHFLIIKTTKDVL